MYHFIAVHYKNKHVIGTSYNSIILTHYYDAAREEKLMCEEKPHIMYYL